jgi:5-methylcytosine-specific restriction enzyme subunit McrC
MTEITLVEYKAQIFNQEEIPEAIAERIWQNYRQYIEIESPNFHNDKCWTIRAKSYIGLIPVTPDFTIRILPKTPISSVLKMLDWIDDFRTFKIFDQLTNCDSIEELGDHLANVLAKNILNRSKKGLFSTYISETHRLNLIRGRIDWQSAAHSPWDTRFHCHYDNHTTDIVDNQILRWTLYQLGATKTLFKAETKTRLRSAYRALSGSISLQNFSYQDCFNRSYNRLNEDYQALHLLCGFFLENLHPSHLKGSNKSLPFLIDTAILYEKFVYAWLKKNLPDNYSLKAQEHYHFAEGFKCYIDLVLYDSITQKAIAVLDTKYKVPSQPSTDDIFQIIAYAHFKQTSKAFLIYPEQPQKYLDEFSHNVHVKTLEFSLDTSLSGRGQGFLDNLLHSLSSTFKMS